MRITFSNNWIDNSMSDGGCFPIDIIEIYVDIHPAQRYFSFTVFNFGVVIELRGKP